MKTKHIVILVALMAIGLNVHAQDNEAQPTKGFYLRAGGGFIAQTGKTEFNNADPNGITMIQQSTEISTDGSTINVKALNGTLGGGFKFNLTGGYMFNDYIGAELGINYFNSSKETIGKLTSPQLISEETAYIRGVDLMPAIYLTPNFKKLNPYARVGLVMTGAGKLYIDTDVRQIDGGGIGTDIVVNVKTEVKSKFSTGLGAAAGVTYPIGNKLNLFGEVEFRNFSIKSKSASIKEYETRAVTGSQSQLVPGQQLADLPTSEKEFIFTDNYSQSATSPVPTNEARKIPTQYVNASGTGINVGVRYSF
ncbi:outer membrane beta-barrel protein [Bizionia arctica]|uniref:Membrane protein n=1 Tax=Bizionia arctica TaxID=1495645 RepID=A0A917LPF8_9FLAO|nr:outer membrane beta-barrel protein [Bizionia arctica]GGG49398.1 membrane protein [Bizionia arctica]